MPETRRQLLPHLVVLRLSGEIWTKSRPTQARFRARLMRNLKDAMRAEELRAHIVRTHNRIFVEASEPRATAVLARVFGIQSISPAVRRSVATLDDVVEAGAEIFGDRVKGKRFAVRARRVGDRTSSSLSSREVERDLGRRLLPLSTGVDLDAPEVTAFVEFSSGEAYFFPERVAGPAGLPLGVEGRAVALVSGGFDSAVAAWLVQKRGVALDHVFCNLGGAAHEAGVLRVMKTLADRWSYGSAPRLHAIDFRPLAEQLQARTQPRYWQVLLKRLMLRAAEAVAKERRAIALVTGEALGQVSSQTLANLAVITPAATLPVLRPVIGMNKDEILAVARAIGTYELSAVVGEYCALAPGRPATEAQLAAVLGEESKLDLTWLTNAVIARKVFHLRSLDLESVAAGAAELELDAIPEDAIVIDLRPRAAYQGWHWPGALWLDFARAAAAYPKFDPHRNYLVYCEFGLKSAHLAELMRKSGLHAHNFRGGLRRLVAHALARGIAGPELP
ncbi:MAG TPA: tRNA uracil 4-sulfurtransferase ThiI [Myxococcota bacterium]|nr:tRNA uracil 4-sulfurtransferase ThiI [Myxococcota bacterium]